MEELNRNTYEIGEVIMFVLQTTRCWYLGMGCLDWNGGMERSTYKTSHYVLPFRLPDMGVEELGVSITGLE